MHRLLIACTISGLLSAPLAAEEQVDHLPGTEPYTDDEDLPDRVLRGVHQFLQKETAKSIESRSRHWDRDLSSPRAYGESVRENRERFRRMIGIVDERLPLTALEFIASTSLPAHVAEAETYSVYAVRWPVFDGVSGEGLLLEPKGEPTARVVALPDADQTPEMLAGLAPGIDAVSQFARRLAEQGCQVVVPVLISREQTSSGNPELGRFTNQPHREWIYRQSYQMGRHIIGSEVQKVLSVIDWFESETGRRSGGEPARIGVAGYAEGGLLALYAAAVDTRIEVALVSGYFDSRQGVWEEPLYRNVFGLLEEFGDAEIASLVAPRMLLIEPSDPPTVEGPPPPAPGRRGAAPGGIAPPPPARVQAELARTHELLGELGSSVRLVSGGEGDAPPFGSKAGLEGFLSALGVPDPRLETAFAAPRVLIGEFPVEERQRRQVKQLQDFSQSLIIPSETDRAEFFWNRIEKRVRASEGESPAAAWEEAVQPYREHFWDEVIGRFPPATLPINARTRKVRDEPTWTGYLVVLDVWPDVISWGYLLVPKDLEPEERRPAVVCQHGLGGTPESTLDPESGAYRGYAASLAERGFIVFTHYNPNAARGNDRFMLLQRLANPLKRSIFSVILGQHARVLDFLGEQPFVDSRRIGFYGLSYGGKTAMRVPALLEGYALSICSGDFNEWIRKVITIDAVTTAPAPAQRFSGYPFTIEYEIPEFNLGRTYNYAEMAALIAPRPFMVERGHFDRVASDEWVSYEYSKVFRLYNALLKIPERTTMEIFDGGHEIHGEGTFEFLHQHLDWPRPASED